MGGVIVPAARSCVFLLTNKFHFDAAGQIHDRDIRVFMAAPISRGENFFEILLPMEYQKSPMASG